MATIKCFFILLCCCFSISNGRAPPAEFRVEAVNLGGWLVTEGWIKPSLFDGIHNKDLLDGTGIQFKSAKSGKYLSAETFKIGGSAKIVAKKTSAAEWETFKLWRVDSSNYNFRAANTQFVALGLDGKQSLITVAKDPTIWETFEIIRKADDLNRVRIKGRHGFFWQVKSEGVVTADWDRFNTTWGDDDPSVFLITTVGGYQGEYQVTNGYGPLTAPQVMKEHWNTYIVENDFKFIAENGLNAVRIPVGWWIAGDPNPPKPFVGGSLQALDNAFLWAQKYGLKVIIDLHAAPGSQNGMEHSATRDGSLEWGLTDESIQQTVAVIDFLAARYAKNPSLLAVELLNEPLAPGVALDTLTRYYRDAYDAVRKHSSTAYVILSNRLGPADHTELFALASVLTKPVIDVHYYNLFSTIFTNMTVQQHIDYVKTNRTAELASITSPNGPKIFVGEWVAEWDLKGATRQDYQAFARAQLHAYKQATFGWAYWTLKNVNEHWSLEWMINNGYLVLKA